MQNYLRNEQAILLVAKAFNYAKGEDNFKNIFSAQPQEIYKQNGSSQANDEQEYQNKVAQRFSPLKIQNQDSNNSYAENIDENAQQGNQNPKSIQKRLKDKSNFHFLNKELDINSGEYLNQYNISQIQSPQESFLSKKEQVFPVYDCVKENQGIEGHVNALYKQTLLKQNNSYDKDKFQSNLSFKKTNTLKDFKKQLTYEDQKIMEHNQNVIRKNNKMFTYAQQQQSKQSIPSSQKSGKKYNVLYAKSINDLISIEQDLKNMQSPSKLKPDIINYNLIKMMEEEENNQDQDLQENKDDTKVISSYKRLRRSILSFIETIYYRMIMISICILNIAAYAMHDYKDRQIKGKEDQNVNSTAQTIELVTVFCFLTEIIFELIARGLYQGKRGFFKNPWLVSNLISIVCSGITQIPGIPDKLYLVCRIFAMLRPMRIIQMITPLKLQFDRLFRSIPKINLSIWRILIFMAFYAIVGLHIFMGALEYRCRVTSDPPPNYNDEWLIYEDIPYLCGRWECPQDSFCRSPYTYDRPYFSKQSDIENLNYGYTNFDNFGDSYFTVFHIMRIISWGTITFMYWRQMSTVIVATYFLSLLLIISYVLSNIILAELYESFEEQRSIKSYAEYRIQKQQEKNQNTKVNIKNIELEYQKQIKQDIPKDAELFRKNISKDVEFILEEDDEGNDLEGAGQVQQNQVVQLQNEEKSDHVNMNHLKSIGLNAKNQQNENMLQNAELATEQIIHNDHQQANASKATLSNQTNSLQDKENIKKDLYNKNINLNFNEIENDNENRSFKEQVSGEQQHMNNSIQNSNKSPKNQIQNTPHRLEHIHVVDFYVSEEKLEKKISLWVQIGGLQGLLSIFFRLVIFLDIIVLSADRSTIGQDEAEIYILIDWATLWVFLVEVIVKIAQLRLDYFKDILNDIDIVILVVRLITTNYPLFQGKSITSEEEWVHAIKSINVFRIFQIVKNTSFFRTVNHLIIYFYDTICELFYFIVIIVFYCVLFALIGENLFAFKAQFVNGDQIPEDRSTGQSPRINYDNFFSSFEATILNILNEQWNISMYNYMRSIGDYVCAYWIIVISTGEIFIIKLLMALFINTFLKHFNSRKKDQNDAKEEAQINQIVRTQVQNGKTQHFEHNNKQKQCFLIKLCKKIEDDHRFENFIMFIIIINIIVMAIDSPLLDHHDPTKIVIHDLEIFFTCIYGAEILIKIIACGLFQKGGYFREPKNYFDFSLFCLNIAGFIFSSKLAILNALRAFHIIVLSKHFESLRIILVSLYQSLPYLFKLLFFSTCFLLVFAIIPLRLLKGKMHSCVTIDQAQLMLVTSQIDCLDLGGDWVKNDFHYDNMLYSLFNLFIIASCEGWSYFSYKAQDAVGLNLQPIQDYNRYWSIFFIVYFFIGNIMVINAFTGVMTQKFNEINGKFIANQTVIPIKDSKFIQEYSSFKFTEKITQEEQEWIQIKRQIYRANPIKTFGEPDFKTKKLQYYIYKIVNSKLFELFIDFCTVLSAIIFSMYVHRIDQQYTDYLNNINDIIVLIFCFEFILKLIVQGKHYFFYLENWFLLFIIVTSSIPSIYRITNQSGNESVYFKLLEVFRILRLINTIPIIRSVFSMMGFILPQVAPIAAVYFFTIYIYALFGMNLFGFTKPQNTLNGYDLHFKNFTSSVFTLIRISSGEQWFYIIPDVARQQQPNFVCQDISDFESYHEHGLVGCGTTWAYIYFFTFHLIVSVIIFNLFIAVLLGLIKTQNTAISKYQLSQIKELWRAYDHQGYGFIDYINFWQFTSRIAMIYGVKKDDLLDPNQKKNFLKFLSLPIYVHKRKNNSIFGFRFHDVVVKMTQISLFLKYGILPGGKDESQTILTQFYKELDQKTKFVGELSTLKSGDIAVIILIQRKIKHWMRKGIELNQIKKQKPEEYEETIKRHHNTVYENQQLSNRDQIANKFLKAIDLQVQSKNNSQELSKLRQEDKNSNDNKIESMHTAQDNTKQNNIYNFHEEVDQKYQKNSDESSQLSEISENFNQKKVDENVNYNQQTTARVFETVYFTQNNTKLKPQ
ncbi:hypothetical protein ABPG74_001792 [Tetrahymena malaccensis]